MVTADALTYWKSVPAQSATNRAPVSPLDRRRGIAGEFGAADLGVMEATELIDTLEKHVLASSGGLANERALKRFNALARQLEDRLGASPGREHLGAACGWATILYSSQRHRSWRRGVGQVHQIVLDHLQAVRSSLP